MLLRILIVVCFTLGVAQAQDIQYVHAENGLVVREKPSQGAIKVGLLDYGTAVEIIEHTNLMLDVKDKNEKVTGEWVKVRGLKDYEFFKEGYVFNGFLTEEKIEEPLKVKYDAFTLYVDELQTDVEGVREIESPDNKVFTLKVGATPEDRYIKVKHHQEYRTIQVFQRHKNSISISNEGPHCDLKAYKHYYSSWKPLKMVSSSNVFKTIAYKAKDHKRFVNVDMGELKAYVKDNCGEDWGKLIETSKSIKDANIDVGVSEVQLRVLMTDIDGHKTERIIVFEVPMGC